jgi:hypothetical protein
MALLFVDSFDHYQTDEIPAKWTANGGAEIVASQGRCGTSALFLGPGCSASRGIAFSGATAVIGFAFRERSQGTSPGTSFEIVTIDDATGWLVTITRQADGSLAVYRALNEALLAQTAPNTIRLDLWYFIELKALIHASAGAVTLRVNNVEQFAVTGVNTLPSGRTPTPRNVAWRSTSFAQTQYYYVDDFYALDTSGAAPGNDFLGDVRVEYLRPRAAGASQAWTPFGSSSHWITVDDNATPDEDASYVEANAAGLTDSNLYQPTGLPAGPIFGAQLSLYARKTEIGPRIIAPVVNGTSGPPTYGPSFETYQYYSTPYALNPATGNPWTIAEINAIDAGVTVVS